jgi:hypothetical protein
LGGCQNVTRAASRIIDSSQAYIVAAIFKRKLTLCAELEDIKRQLVEIDKWLRENVCTLQEVED